LKKFPHVLAREIVCYFPYKSEKRVPSNFISFRKNNYKIVLFAQSTGVIFSIF